MIRVYKTQVENCLCTLHDHLKYRVGTPKI